MAVSKAERAAGAVKKKSHAVSSAVSLTKAPLFEAKLAGADVVERLHRPKGDGGVATHRHTTML